MNKRTPSLALILSLFMFHCATEFGVNESEVRESGDTGAQIDTSSVIEFVGTSDPGTVAAQNCITANAINVYTAADLDRDGVVDPCDEFVAKTADNVYTAEGQGYYFGYRVWGWKDIIPGHTNSSETTFTFYNYHVEYTGGTPMDLKIKVTGSAAGNFLLKSGAQWVTTEVDLPVMALNSSHTISMKMVSTDMNNKNATLQVTVVNSGNIYNIPLSGSTLVCNGSSLHCERRFNQVAYMATHNAHTSEDDFDGAFSFIGINHVNNISKQLAFGIRGLMLDWYWDDGRARNCHGDCVWGYTDAQGENIKIAQWLANNPTEVIHMINEDKMGQMSRTDSTIINGGLYGYIFQWSHWLPVIGVSWNQATDYHAPFVSHTDGGKDTTVYDWPYLGWMVENNKRFVFFTEGGDQSKDNDKYFGRPFQYYPGSYSGAMQCRGRSHNDARLAAMTKAFYVLSNWETCDASSASTFFCNIGGGIKSAQNVHNTNAKTHAYAKNCWNNVENKTGDGNFNPNFLMPVSINVDFHTYGQSDGGFRKTVDQLNAAWPDRNNF